MNKTFKKMLSLVIALAMVMAMGLTAFAAEGDITIKFPTDAKYASHQYEVYQIFTGEVGEDGKTLKNLKYGENTKTATGKLIYKFADMFIVQWEEMLELYPKAVLGGAIY